MLNIVSVVVIITHSAISNMFFVAEQLVRRRMRSVLVLFRFFDFVLSPRFINHVADDITKKGNRPDDEGCTKFHAFQLGTDLDFFKGASPC